MEKRFEACMLLHALGDTIGFKNSEWEFNFHNSEYKDVGINSHITMEIVFQFIELGGIKHINLKDWIVSDDTVLHLATAEALISKYKNLTEFEDKTASLYVKGIKDKYELRYFGVITGTNICRIIDGKDWRKLEYNFEFGGSGAAMRTSCIGLAFYGKKNRGLLIQSSLEASRITHNSVIGYLGGVTSALFTAFAIEQIPIEEWCFRLVDILDSNVIETYLEKSGPKSRGLKEYKRDKNIFIDQWKKYIEMRFDSNKKPIYSKVMRNIAERIDFYYENFSRKIHNDNGKQLKVYFPGGAGDDSVIISYDCLLDARDNWEKLVFYSMLHAGDSDTTGCIAASWYGAFYGMDDVPKSNLKYLEYKDRIIKDAKMLYIKFSK